MNQKSSTQKLVTLSVLVAIQIVLSRFLSFSAWNVKIGFGFVPVAVTAMLYGPAPAGMMAAVSDFLGAMLFPRGTYFPGFSFSALITGLILGIFLYRNAGTVKVAAAVILDSLITTLFLNTLWLSILYGSDFRGLLSARFLQALVLFPVKFIVLSLLVKLVGRTDIRKVLMQV